MVTIEIDFKKVDSLYDRENSRIKKFFLLTEEGIEWFHRVKDIEESIFSQ